MVLMGLHGHTVAYQHFLSDFPVFRWPPPAIPWIPEIQQLLAARSALLFRGTQPLRCSF